jgi:hypothetical protein
VDLQTYSLIVTLNKDILFSKGGQTASSGGSNMENALQTDSLSIIRVLVT